MHSKKGLSGRDQWTRYGPLVKDFANLAGTNPSSKKGSNFSELHRTIMSLMGLLRGAQHHFSRSLMKEGIFMNLIEKMVNTSPCYIKNISI